MLSSARTGYRRRNLHFRSAAVLDTGFGLVAVLALAAVGKFGLVDSGGLDLLAALLAVATGSHLRSRFALNLTSEARRRLSPSSNGRSRFRLAIC